VSEDDKIIREEIDAILSDIRKFYEASGKKASGEFGKGLEAIYEPNKGTIRGFVYLAGRKAGKMPPVGAILNWLKIRGIRSVRKNQSVRSLAWAIAKKIAKEGTKQENALKIYEEVITPQRINKIIDRVAKLNVNRIITEIRAELEVLAKNV
jgi:hypothetical protein